MRSSVGMFSLLAWLAAVPEVVMAQMETLSVTVSYRERIALPPGARLDLRIVEVADTDRRGGAIGSQLFALTGVPMAVTLTYDPQVVDDGALYGISAAILAPDGQQIFRATEPLGALDGSPPAAVDVVLEMLPATEFTPAVPRRISGVSWTVTEVFGEAWQDGDPATLVLDEDMTVSIFGGCNRFSGKAALPGHGLAFPGTLAGTMMACPDGVGLAERRFLAALGQVTDFVRYGAGLVLSDVEGRAVLHFVETPG